MMPTSVMYLVLALFRISHLWVYAPLGASDMMVKDILIYLLVCLCSTSSFYSGICSLKVRHYHDRLLYNERLLVQQPFLRKDCAVVSEGRSALFAKRL